MGRQSTRKQRRQEERQIAKQQRKSITPPVDFISLPTFREPEPEAKIRNRVFYTEAMLEKIGEANLTANDLKALLFIRLKCVKDCDWSKKQGYCYTIRDAHHEMRDKLQMSHAGAYRAIANLEEKGFIKTSKPVRGNLETTIKYIFENITQDM